MPNRNGLIDHYGRSHDYLRISLTGNCNLNCSYCRPPGSALQPQSTGRGVALGDQELIRLVELFAGLGVRKVRLTGGEPLLRRGIERLIEQISGIDGISTVALTTNGTMLEGKLTSLVNAGLSRLNVSLDSLDAGRFREITGADLFPSVWRGIDSALAYSALELKLNTVVVRGVNDHELADFAALTQDNNLTVRFIEYMPFGDNLWQPDKLVGWREMVARIGERFQLREQEQQGVARLYRVDGFRGKVGFIAPLTGCFCDSCSRLRLTADGCLRLCLHDSSELDLGAMMRTGATDGQLHEAVLAALAGKVRGHGRSAGGGANGPAVASMSSIGG